MTIKELKAQLELLGPGDDDKQFVVWLPGVKIDLRKALWERSDGEIHVEGNVREGSLERWRDLPDRPA